MNDEPQTNSPVSDSPVTDDLASQVGSLRHQITLLLLALIIVSGTLTTYLFYQAHSFGRELATIEPRARLTIENYKNNLPHIQQFVRELVAYGQKHPDFQPILRRNGLPLTLSALTNSVPKPAATKPAATTPTIPQPKQ